MQNVTVFSDYICPFCFVGKRLAERLAENLPIKPVWKGFEIHPETPPEGVPLSSFMPAMISSLASRVRELARATGLDMRMPKRLANSRLALLGSEFAREACKLDQYHEAVFSAYFQQGKDIGDIEVLIEIACETGIDGDSFRKSLVSEQYFPALKSSRREAHSLGLSAVPSFAFGDGNIVVGALPYEALKTAAEMSLRAAKQDCENTLDSPETCR